MFTKITSKDNQYIKNYIRYSEDKKKRNADQVFTMEGLKLIREAFDEKINLLTLFLTPSFIQKHLKSSAFLQDNNLPHYEISEELARKLSNTQNPQGIFAIAKRIDKPLLLDTIYSGGKYIALYNLNDPGNMGTIIRTADVLGIDGLILSSGCCDIYSPKVIRATMGSLFRMPLLYLEEFLPFVKKCSENHVCTLASSVDKTASSAAEYRFSDRTVLFIGNEANGLPEAIQNNCEDKITIPMSPHTESLNAAMAAGILMWEMLKPTSRYE